MNKASYGVKSADRAIEVLERLVCTPEGLTHTDLASDLGIPKSSLTKLLSTLVTSGYAEQGNGGRYRPGKSWRALVKTALKIGTLNDLVQPSLERIVQYIGETAGFNLVRDNEIETIATMMSPQALQFTMRTGNRAPLYAMSSGLAVLAQMSPDIQQRYCKMVEPDLRSRSATPNAAALSRLLAEIRKQGYAQVEGYVPGMCGFGVAVISPKGIALASLNVAIPIIRFNDAVRERTLMILNSVSRELALKLDGWLEPEDLSLPE